jgi:electron transport complex protein RnfC
MRKKTFPGGTHPEEEKSLAEHNPIEALPAPDKVVLPVSQHIGAPAEVCVKVGEAVKKGQRIAEAAGFVSVPVHASLSGTVKAISTFPHPVGSRVLSVVIEKDGKDEWVEGLEERENYGDLDPDAIRDIVREAGIVGMGGAAFPSHVKLSPPRGKSFDTIIINGAECEPFLTADHRLMLESPDDILAGLEIIMKTTGAGRGIIAIEDNKPDCISLMTEKCAAMANIEVAALRVKYPQGAEKQLIYALTRRKVPCGGLPMDVNCLVHNVGTTKAIYDAVRFGIPLIERVVTVSGPAVREPKNLRVRMGTLFADCIEACGGVKGDAVRLINGGPMMGIAQFTDQIPVIKGTSGILLFDGAMKYDSRPCIQCARCVDTCPMSLLPCTISTYVEAGEFEKAEQYGILDCIECGSCAFVCPAKRNLVHDIKFGKAEIASRKKKVPAGQV